MNQIEASFWKKIGAFENKNISDNLIEEELGSQENSNDQGQAYIGMSKFTDDTSQDCKHLFIDMKFRGKFLSWRNSTLNNWDYNSIGKINSKIQL